MPQLAAEILAFWFADALASPAAAAARSKAWFTEDPAFDAVVASRFGDLPDQAASGALDAWAAEPRAALARVIVLDQFPRNLHRGSATAFACDPVAQRAAVAAIDAGLDLRLAPIEAAFLYLPFEHAEDMGLQERAVERFEALARREGALPASLFASYIDFAHRHREVIRRFGRFPHRNGALGRVSTAEEVDYLAGGGERFGGRRSG